MVEDPPPEKKSNEKNKNENIKIKLKGGLNTWNLSEAQYSQ